MELRAFTSGLVTDTHSTQKYPLGSIREVNDGTYGTKMYRYIYNGSGAALAANKGVMSKSGSANYTGAVSGAVSRVRFLGVSEVSIADTYYGWVCFQGLTTMTDSGSGISAAGNPVKLATSGNIADGTVGTDDCIGVAPSAITASATGLVLLNG